MSVAQVAVQFNSLAPHMIVRGAAQAIDFYKKAFGAVESFRFPQPGGDLLMHAELKIGKATVMLCDEIPNMGNCKSAQSLGATPIILALDASDVDAAYTRAIEAGATSVWEPNDTFWGARYCQVKDPFGNMWSISKQLKQLSPDQIAAGAKEAMGSKSC